MSASQRVLVDIGFAKGTGRCRPCKVLVGDGISGALEIAYAMRVVQVMKIAHAMMVVQVMKIAYALIVVQVIKIVHAVIVVQVIKIAHALIVMQVRHEDRARHEGPSRRS